jgi:uncharacterized SAM-binding protein YcdF (DUF218 family)
MSCLHVLRMLGLAGIVCFLLTVFTPLPSVLDQWAGVPPQLEPADAVVVLAGSVHATGVLNHSSLRRAIHGMLLYQRGLAPLVVFSGAPNSEGLVEAEVRAEMAREFGIPSAAILMETTARTTRQEAIQMAALLQPRGIRTILLVTDVEHMRRSRQLFQNAGFSVQPGPVDELSHASSPEGRLRLMRRVLQEGLARCYYQLAGYL